MCLNGDRRLWVTTQSAYRYLWTKEASNILMSTCYWKIGLNLLVYFLLRYVLILLLTVILYFFLTFGFNVLEDSIIRKILNFAFDFCFLFFIYLFIFWLFRLLHVLMGQEFRIKVFENHLSDVVKSFYLHASLLMLNFVFYVSFTWCFLPSSRRWTCLRESQSFLLG